MKAPPPRSQARRRATPVRKGSRRQSSTRAHLSLAKLTPPSLPDLVARPHLTEQIEQIRRKGAKVVWIQAPPGAGKTTLAASYLRTTKHPALWYQLNAGDADPATWLHYLNLGIQQAAPRFRKPMLALEPAYLADLPGFTRRFFEQLFTRLKSPALLIFDNYHDLPTDSPVQALMAEAFRTVPPHMLCIVTSRQAPPPMVATLIADQTLVEFPADALAFDLAETQQLLALHHPKYAEDAFSEWAQGLHAQTQGWVAGVILLGTKTPSSNLASPVASNAFPIQAGGSGDNPILYDYFVQEALRRLSPDVRTLLLKTAMFPAFAITMAQHLTGLSQVGYELNKLARARYFVESREGEQAVFQYHPLFRQFLCQQAELDLGRDAWRALQAQAAEVLVQEGWIEEAIQLFLEAEEVSQVSRLLIERAPALMEQGRFQTLTEWLARLPAEEFEREPYLLYWRGMSQLYHSPEESLRCFQAVFPTFKTRGDVEGMLLAASGAIYSIDWTWTCLDRIDQWLSTIDVLWEKHAPDLLPEVQSTVIIAMMRGLFWRQPHRTIVQAWIERAKAFVLHYDRLSEFTIILHHILCCSRSFGSIQQTVQAIAPVIKRLDHHPLSPPNHLAWEISQIGISWVTGAFQEAKTHFQRGVDLLTCHGLAIFRGPLLFNGLYAALHSQDLEHAETMLPRGELDAQDMGPAFFAIGIFQKGWFYALKGDMEKALDFAQQSIALSKQTQGRHFEAVASLGLVSVLVATGRFKEAEQPLSEVEMLANTMDHVSLTYSCGVLRAYVLLETGPRTQALPVLAQALKLGGQHSIFYTYESWLPSILASLCVLALEEGIEPDYVRQLIRAKQLTLDARTTDTLAWPWPIRIQTLGQFLITTDAGPLTFGRKAPLIPLRLLKLLISLGGNNIALTRLADDLWPDAEGDAAYRSMLTTLTRLRKLLGREDALIVQGGVLSLNTHLCWVDSLAFEYLANLAFKTKKGKRSEQARTCANRSRELYQGSFLEAEDTFPEVNDKRDYLARLYEKLSTI